MLTSTEIGAKIARARKLKNLSQTELANQMSITSQAVGKWERGESMPDIITFNKLANILNVDLNYFSNDFNNKQTPNSLPNSSVKKPEKLEATWDMSYSSYQKSDFSGLSGLGERFSRSNVQSCKFIGSDLSSITLKNNNWQNSNFSESNISNSHIGGSNIENCQFVGCNFQKTKFTSDNIQKSNFNKSDFTDTIFKRCNFEKSTMLSAIWIRTTFQSTNFSEITFTSEMIDCSFISIRPYKTIFQNLTLRNCFFKNCDFKKVAFENCYADNITLAFLKNNKANIEKINIIA